MWSLLVIICLLFQTTVAVYLLNIVRSKDDLDRNLRTFLIILLVHLSTKLLLLAVLRDEFMYTQIPTGFGLAYGPLLWVTTKSYQGIPPSRRKIAVQFLPFLLFSLIYLFLVVTGRLGWVSQSVIIRYTSWYEWLVIASLYSYPLYIKHLLRHNRRAGAALPGVRKGNAPLPAQDRKGRLLVNMANVLVLGMSAGLLLSLVHRTVVRLPGFDLRLLPYICFSAIPILILRYRLQEIATVERPAVYAENTATGRSVITQPAFSGIGQPAAQDRRYEKSGLDEHKMDEYEAALMSFMEKSRIYLDPDLSLDELAAQMKMSRHHLTQLLNDRLMKNFYSFINEYRIGVAIATLADHAAEVNILSLAFDCGFNSRSSFNNYFKKITGYTPSGYRKMQLVRMVQAP